MPYNCVSLFQGSLYEKTGKDLKENILPVIYLYPTDIWLYQLSQQIKIFFSNWTADGFICYEFTL
jgi:hypothetical protein